MLVIVAVFALAGAHPFEHLAHRGGHDRLPHLIVASLAANFAYHYWESHTERAWNAYIAPVLPTLLFAAVTGYTMGAPQRHPR